MPKCLKSAGYNKASLHGGLATTSNASLVLASSLSAILNPGPLTQERRGQKSPVQGTHPLSKLDGILHLKAQGARPPLACVKAVTKEQKPG